MRWLRGLFGTLRARLLGRGEAIRDEWAPSPLVGCSHPQKAITTCTYYAVGPKGKPGWFYRCRACLAWFSC